MATSQRSAHAHSLRLALLLAAGLAAPLGCGDKELTDDTGNSTGGGGDDGGGDDGGTGSDLYPVPDAEYPVCTGEDTGGFVGACCVDVYCTPAKSDGSCAATTETTAEEITGMMLGSGSCECEAPAGPYAPYEGKEGDCCYTVGVQGCEGRPLMIAGRARTAPLLRGRSWAAA